MGRYQEVEDLITQLKEDFSKFYDKENQAAGTRIRKGMQDLKKMAQEIRTEVQETKNKRTEEAAKTATKVAAKAPAKAPAKKK
jgi:hypothetical protein